jgi:hypothetical protein
MHGTCIKIKYARIIYLLLKMWPIIDIVFVHNIILTNYPRKVKLNTIPQLKLYDCNIHVF